MECEARSLPIPVLKQFPKASFAPRGQELALPICRPSTGPRNNRANDYSICSISEQTLFFQSRFDEYKNKKNGWPSGGHPQFSQLSVVETPLELENKNLCEVDRAVGAKRHADSGLGPPFVEQVAAV